MGKALKAVGTAILVGGLALATGGAALIPALAGGGLAGALGTAAFGFTAGQFITAGLALNAVGTTLEQSSSVSGGGASLEWTPDPRAPIPFCFGRVGTTGSIVHSATFGPDSMFVGFVQVVSGAGPIKSWVNFKADDRYVTFNGSGEAVTHPYNDKKMWLDRLRGQQPETRALASPAGLKNGAQMPGWGASYRLSGKAAFMYVLSENSKRSAYNGQAPTPKNTVEGLYAWDPRVSGCLLGDPTTWIYSENPAIHALKWITGLWEGPAGTTPQTYGVPYKSRQVGGIGAAISGVDVDAYVELANICDVHGWKSAAVTTTDDDKSAVLDEFLRSASAVYSTKAGLISCLHRAAERVSIADIYDEDTAGDVTYASTASRLNRINTIRPSFWSEANDWQMTEADEVTAQEWQEEDGVGAPVQRTKSIDYKYIPQAVQVRQVACLDVANAREGIKGKVPLRPYYQGLEAGDCVTLHLRDSVLNGLKVLIVDVDDETENDRIVITFESESDAKYGYAFGLITTPPSAPSITPSDPTVVNGPLPGEWNIVPRPPEQSGAQQPGLDLTGIISNARAERVLVEHSLDPSGPWTQAYDGPPTTERIEITGLSPGAAYYVAITYFNAFGNPSPRTVYGPYTAGDLIAGGLAPESPDWDTIRELASGEGVAELIEAAEGRMRAALESADARLTSGLGALSDALDGLELEDLDGFLAFSSSVQSALDGKASHGEVSGLATRVTSAETTLAAQNTRLNTVETDVAGKAAATDVADLTARVTSAEAVNTAQNTRLNTVESDVAGKASAASLADLSAEVANARDGSTTLKARLTSDRQAVVDGLAGKASASDLNNLTARVTSAEGVNTAQNTRLNTVETDIAGKASASDLNNLIARVTSAEGVNTAQNTRLNTVEADVAGKASAASVADLGVTVGGFSASIQAAQSVAADAQGKANAKIGAILDVNGRVTGWSSTNNGAVGHTTFVTDTFNIVPPGGAGSNGMTLTASKLTIRANNINVVELGIGVNA